VTLVVFTTHQLEKQPRGETYDVRPLLQTQKEPQRLLDEHMETLRELLAKLKEEADHKGFVVRNNFKDFDIHNHGLVTKSQFLQSIPFRTLNKDELQIIVERYTNNDGLVNYVQFHEEIEGKEVLEIQKTHESSSYLAKRRQGDLFEAEEVENRIRVLLMKHRLRLDENFRDYDPLRSGFITSGQFKSALGSIKFPKTQLTDDQLETLISKYIAPYDETEYKVKYTDFLENMNKVFTEKGLEKIPTKSPVAPKHLLLMSKQNLANEKETEIEKIIKKIKNLVATKRIYLKPFFQDFDQVTKGTYSTHHVSKHRFERALHMLGIKLSPSEYNLLCQKYDDKGNSDVNYVMFMKDIQEGIEEPEFTLQPDFTIKNKAKVLTMKQQQTLEYVLEKIVFRLYVDRIRLPEFLSDYDPLRSGLATQTQFRSGLSAAKLRVDNDEFAVLMENYSDGKIVKWRKFCDDVDRIFTEKQLEKDPRKETVDSKAFTQTTIEKRGPKGRYESNELKDVLKKVINYVSTRRVVLKPRFQDFDKFNRGKVTQAQFSQCLDKVFSFNEKELQRLVDMYHEESTGLCNYIKFIEDVDPQELNTTGDTNFHKELAFTRSRAMVSPDDVDTRRNANLEKLMVEIRSQVSQHRIRLRDFFTDFDRLRHGLVTPNKFKAGLSMAKINLNGSQLQLLEDCFKIDEPDQPLLINYIDFCNYGKWLCWFVITLIVDLVFTEPRLEKSPTKSVSSFQSKPRFTLTHDGGYSSQLDQIYEKLIEVIDARHVLMKPYFQDYDPLTKERVTKTQFSSVLDMLNLGLSSKEVKLLADRYLDERGDVDYVTLCQNLDEMTTPVESINPHIK
jgi:Ca2+-binding EF-hand superfamily protein